jgi:hypothetical protein
LKVTLAISGWAPTDVGSALLDLHVNKLDNANGIVYVDPLGSYYGTNVYINYETY